MNDDRSKRIIKILLLSWIFVIVLIIGLSFLIYFSFTKNHKDIQSISQEMSSLKVMKPLQGVAGDSIIGPVGPQGPQGPQGSQGIQGVPGPAGKDGTNSTSTTVIVQQPIQGIPTTFTGPQGLPGKDARQIEFDGSGHWRYIGDDIWQPLIQGLQ